MAYSEHVGTYAARGQKRWRDPAFVKSQNRQRHGPHFSCVLFLGDFPIASNARPTSSINTAKSKVRTDFFGLITISNGTRSIEPRCRTASRNRRLMRLRSTAPPKLPANGESNANATLRSHVLRARQIKDGHVRRKVPSPLFVDTIEIGVFRQPPRPWETLPRVRRRLFLTPAGSVDAHNFTILHNS